MDDVQHVAERSEKDQQLHDDRQADADIETFIHDFQTGEHRFTVGAGIESVGPLANHQRYECHGLGVVVAVTIFEKDVDDERDGRHSESHDDHSPDHESR